MARPYQRWTNHRRARRAKMNGSLSSSVLLSLRSSLSAIPRPLFPHLGFRHLSLPRFIVYPACSVRPTVRTFASCQCSRALHVALYPATFQRLTRYFLSSSRFLHLSFSSSSLCLSFLSLFFSLSISRLSAVFLSRFYSISVFPSEIIFSFFFGSRARQHFFEFLLRTHYLFPIQSVLVLRLFFLTQKYNH